MIKEWIMNRFNKTLDESLVLRRKNLELIIQGLEKYMSKTNEEINSNILAADKKIVGLDSKCKSLEETIQDLESKLDVEGYKRIIDDRSRYFNDAIEELNRGIPIKENIETVIQVHEVLFRMYRQVAEDTLTKYRVLDKSADTWAERSSIFEASGITGRTTVLTVPEDCGITIYAVKFLSGDGYGKYEIKVNGIKHGWFMRRENGSEDGVIFFFRMVFGVPHNRIEISQAYGGGKLEGALKYIIAGQHLSILQTEMEAQ